MNSYIVMEVQENVRLYIINKNGDVSSAYLTFDQVKKREDLQDYFEYMKVLQEEINNKTF